MYRIRCHGRGGQGMKTAIRILGSTFFRAGYEVQDAPHYGAERRGAPISSSVRAARHPIDERGPILRPDLVVVADDTLLSFTAPPILQGIDSHTVLLIVSMAAPEHWKERLDVTGTLLTLPVVPSAVNELRFLGALCAGAAARLVGLLDRVELQQALHDELSSLDEADAERSALLADAAWEGVSAHAGPVREGDSGTATGYTPPEWIDLPADRAGHSAAIHAGLTMLDVKTGMWRAFRPVIAADRCRRCWWLCSEFCPDSAVVVRDDGTPEIDYDHCKGCLICVASCPHRAICAVPEQEGPS